MAVHIKDILGDFFKQQGNKNLELVKLEEILNQLLEKNWKEYIDIKEIKDNIIVFRTQSAGIRYGLYLKKNNLLKKIQECFPKIIDIKIVLN